MSKKHLDDTQGSRLGPERIRAILEDYCSGLPDHIEDEVSNYMNLLALWDRKVALTSIHDPEQIVRFHFGESIFALSLICDRDGRLADVGSGAGFPGLALKLAAPGLSVILVEPNKKKSAFLHEVIRGLSIRGVEITSTRFDLAGIEQASLSLVTCRALGQHQAVLRWAKERLKPGGSVLFWLGREVLEEVSHTVGWKWDKPILIPGTVGRFILEGTAV